jgi:hypothetical protein
VGVWCYPIYVSVEKKLPRLNMSIGILFHHAFEGVVYKGIENTLGSEQSPQAGHLW